jgi:adenylyltransferase/sulfurtransferase
MTDKYDRQIRFLGQDGHDRLRDSLVTIVGVGGLGSVIANQLARSGIGYLQIIDDDKVDETNLHRTSFETEDEGQYKVVALKNRLAAKYPDVKDVFEHPWRLDESRLCQLSSSKVVIDGTDNLATRYLINDFCVKYKIPWIYGGCINARGMVMTIIPGETPCLRCLFPFHETASGAGESVGVLASTVAFIASFQVQEALKICAGMQWEAVGSMLYFDIWNGKIHRMMAERREDCECCGSVACRA